MSVKDSLKVPPPWPRLKTKFMAGMKAPQSLMSQPRCSCFVFPVLFQMWMSVRSRVCSVGPIACASTPEEATSALTRPVLPATSGILFQGESPVLVTASSDLDLRTVCVVRSGAVGLQCVLPPVSVCKRSSWGARSPCRDPRPPRLAFLLEQPASSLRRQLLMVTEPAFHSDFPACTWVASALSLGCWAPV